ncbi:MAG: hypothetical protein WBQ50_21350 [Nocardioides sp.]
MPDWSLVSRPHVLSAIQECDRVGSSDFLSRYRFGRARASTMWHSSEEYDPLAILGFAHLEATGHAPSSADMGDAEAADVLTGLGFDVVVDEDALAQIKTKPRRTPAASATKTAKTAKTAAAPRARKAASASATPRRTPKVEVAPNICPTCHMAIPATGLCDNCD